ncbi:tRNA uridine-5-carboxymethylaminomethyl(34) synthesis GTPase MnmE [Orrella daihaiensis]|uniref:tRNA modification GTPase MnmE n=1 Tax=Orrella daihaiensis TaxID=2782176 RepID=A0ABY4AJS8_9BURK|nr:tRNA uridine-5-carboxymethylaminomethyl(34) synthesis GTPase MnmE [Orrella daihaiensis]UOD50536.1 tRNA uridine-5-carboxymethylaminomethyl(34) synthesis GTPase MnmE [Orrella daihaiensis]
MTNDDPIAAIATASGRGSIGVIRVSGKNLQNFFQAITAGFTPSPRSAHYLPILDADGSLIDQAIVIYFQAPQSYTGEDVVELQGHGGPAVMQLLLKRCLTIGQSIGLRLAEPGEFTLRAFLNDKLDLAQAEAVADMIEASSTAAAKAAAASLSGTFSREIEKLALSITEVRILVEATLDFPEEEIEFIEKYQVRSRLASIKEQLDVVLTTSRQSSYLKEGLKVVLAGEPNVGKSSLLNAIFGQDIAIVTDIAGTTRDRIRETLDIDGVPILMTDTAGLRQTTDKIEAIGIERSWQAIAEADLILDIVDARQPNSLLEQWPNQPELANKAIVRVNNKSDLINEKSIHLEEIGEKIMVSAKSGYGIDRLKSLILAKAGRQLGDVSPWLGRQRHVLALESASRHLDRAIEHAMYDDRVLDLLAEELRLAHDELGTITGTVSADDMLGHIFSSFCIGK